jgi:hypothetical protein
MTDTRAREYAEQIGSEFRDWLNNRVKTVPEQYRVQVMDYVINGAALGWAKNRRKK